MLEEDQKARLERELERLNDLDNASTIVSVESSGDPPTRYKIRFAGRGIKRSSSISADVEVVESHECELRLPSRFPEQPPDIRWLTPIFHPNISFSGFITLADLGLEWDPEMGLDIICESLWDLLRMAIYDLESATNLAAQVWFEKESSFRTPLDHRPIRDKHRPASSNVIQYQRRAGARTNLMAESLEEPIDAEVFYIGNETTPPIQSSEAPKPPIANRRGPEDDIFYIGDDA